MQTYRDSLQRASRLVAAALAGLAFNASADVVTDWNVKSGEIILEVEARHAAGHPRDG